ncbi:dihydrofolate reductase family protein [Planococcus sp. NCCP-2050]|uniref:dihydrofolate reductase family protein n=1 Tax=Planococcus sp. NCCP-2050 TaxID=2944679 RepID=UPI00203AC3C2|nr:dihydrofolate reductase family protein [Planococcus sp. NCCP-2050]GKW46474.1 dihydrofolate reductase [Planococcus sp. NCCP-2050]
MGEQRKVVCYIAESLDGYIATEDDSLDWLFKVEMDGDAGYAEFMETVDTVVMGRRTYEWVMEMEKGKFPYEDKECYVFSTRSTENSEHAIFTNEDIPSFVERLRKRQGKNIWVIGGSLLIEAFLREDLIDEFIISIAPALIGKGIPLFQKLDKEIEYELKSVKQSGQFAQLHLIRK